VVIEKIVGVERYPGTRDVSQTLYADRPQEEDPNPTLNLTGVSVWL